MSGQGLEAKIVRCLEVSGPSGLGGIARNLGLHHKTVESVLRQSNLVEVDDDGTWRLLTQGS